MFGLNLETKAKSKNTVYPRIVESYGKHPRYSSVNYRTIAKEGYSENHVFFRCLTEIIKGCQQVEWKAIKTNKDGTTEEIYIPVLDILNKPSKQFSKQEFIKRVVAFYYIGGEAPLQKIITTSSGIKELYAYRPDKMEIEFTGDMDKPYSKITYMAGNQIPIDPKNFCLFKNFNPLDELDGLGHGMSMLSPSLKNGDLLNAFIDWNVSLLQNGAAPSGAWVIDDMLDKDEYELANTKMSNKITGVRNAGKPLFLDGGAKWVQMGQNPKDMDWKDGKESTIIDICVAIGVDPILVGYNKFSSYNNKREAKKDLYTSTVIPFMQEFAGALTSFLLKEEDLKIDVDFSHLPIM